MHKEHHEHEPHYWVVAKITEPQYESELRYIAAERQIVSRKLHNHRRRFKNFSAPSLGIFNRDDWHAYAHALDHYEDKLAAYAHSVKEEGILPVKFAVYNDAGRPDHNIKVRVSVHEGRVDEKRTPPSRPDRIDSTKPVGKWPIPKFWGEFKRRAIKIAPHSISAEFSKLNGHDGAVLINQLVHVHCGPETEVKYEIKSSKVHHETGDVLI